MKTIIPSEIPPAELQAVMQTAIAPRPVALASTIDLSGQINLSPFSFFNMFSTVPPVVIFSPSSRIRDNTIKHTLENVKEVPEVAIGIVNYSIVQQVSLASTEYEKEINEFSKAGLTMKEADLIRPKLITECPVNFECKVLEIKPLGNRGGAGNLVICEILRIHIHEEYTMKTAFPIRKNWISLPVLAQTGTLGIMNPAFSKYRNLSSQKESALISCRMP